MEQTYKMRRTITKIILAPLLLILLIALSYKIWGVSYNPGSVEEIVISNATNIEQCIASNATITSEISGSTALRQFIQLLSNNYFVSLSAVVVNIQAIILLENKGMNKKNNTTLVSLCVRMDD